MRRSNPYIPEAQAIDPASGFKVPHRELERQYDGEYVARRFLDKRNPQDLIRPRPDRHMLPHPRPESEDTFLSAPILDEEGFPILGGDGLPIMTEGASGGVGL